MLIDIHQNRAFIAIVESEAHVKEGRNGTEFAQRLVDEAKDVLAIALDKKVRKP